MSQNDSQMDLGPNLVDGDTRIGTLTAREQEMIRRHRKELNEVYKDHLKQTVLPASGVWQPGCPTFQPRDPPQFFKDLKAGMIVEGMVQRLVDGSLGALVNIGCDIGDSNLAKLAPPPAL